MNIRRMALPLGLTALSLIATIASARDGKVQFAQGIATVEGEKGLKGVVQVHVRNVVGEKNSNASGEFSFKTFHQETRTEREINTVGIREFTLDGDGKIAKFSGHAVLFIRTPKKLERLRGIVLVKVSDLANPKSAGPVPDMLSFVFTPAAKEANPIVFNGAVRRGDLIVGVRPK